MGTTSVCEEQNFNFLINEHGRSLRNFLLYLGGNADESEDIAQETFIKMWENCEKVIFAEARSYLFSVAKRAFFNVKRHEKVKIKFQQQPQRTSETQDPSFEMQETEFHERLKEAINSLPEGQKEVFLLNRMEKMTYREIAESLELSVKAVEKRMSNALLHLKKELEEFDNLNFL